MAAPGFVLHVGVHKTGTSAFQHWAAANRDSLRSAGYLYPKAGSSPTGNHHTLVMALAGGTMAQERRAHVLRLLDQEIRSAPGATVLISSETMSTVRYLPVLPQLRSALAKRSNGTAAAVVTVRDQVSWSNSCYAQMREMLTPVAAFDRFLAPGRHGVHNGNWDFLENSFLKAGFEVEALPFDAEFRRHGAVRALATAPSLTRLATLDLGERTETNPSLSALQLLVSDEVRRTVGGEGPVEAPLRNDLMGLIAKHTRALKGPSFNGHTTETARAYAALFEESNASFAARHFGKTWIEIFPPSPIPPLSPMAVFDLPPDDRKAVVAATKEVLREAKAVRYIPRKLGYRPARAEPLAPARILVHAGFAKTGTTAFQEWLATNRDALRAAGYYLPRAGVNKAGNGTSLLSRLAGLMAPARGEMVARRFRRELARSALKNVIVSSEAVTAPHLAPHRQELAAALTAGGNAVTVLLAVRDQVAWFNSAYGHMHAQFHPRPPFDLYVKNVIASGRLDWARQQASFEELGLDFSAVAYTSGVAKEGIVAALTRLPELAPLAPLAVGASRQRANTSAGWKQLLVSEEIRRWVEAQQRTLSPAQRHALRDIVDRHMAGIEDERFNGFSPELLAMVRMEFAQSNDAFAKHHFGARWRALFPPGSLPPPSPTTLAELPGADAKELRQVIAACREEATATFGWNSPRRRRPERSVRPLRTTDAP